LQTPENVSVPRTPSAPSKSGSSRSSSNVNSQVGEGAGSSVDADAPGKNSTTSTTTASKSTGAYANPFQAYLSNLSPEHGAGRSLNIDLSTALPGAICAIKVLVLS